MSEPATALIADCPWLFRDALPGKGRGASKNYPCMSAAELCHFPLPPLARDCVLFFWRVSSMVPEAHAIIRAWGFQSVGAELVWIKTTATSGGAIGIRDPLMTDGQVDALLGNRTPRERADLDGMLGKLSFGMGWSCRGAHETVIIAKRGKPKIHGADVRSVFFAPMPTEPGNPGKIWHSAKPDTFYRLVEKMVPEGPIAELFARRRRGPRYVQFGNQLPDEGEPPMATRQP